MRDAPERARYSLDLLTRARAIRLVPRGILRSVIKTVNYFFSSLLLLLPPPSRLRNNS